MSAAALHLQARGLALNAGGRPSGRRLFTGLDLDVHDGECWVVLGPNGAGKSSLLAALAGVFEVAGGRIALQGRALADWRAAELADRRAWCPQFWIDPFPATVTQTLRLVRDRTAWWPRDGGDDAELEAMLSTLDLHALGGADVRTLSGGERQRVAIASTLLQGAPLVLLDEPASHLDLAHQRMLVDVLRTHVGPGRAVVASLHDLNLAAELATHALLLDGRGGVAAGPADEVMTPDRLSRAFGVAIERVEMCGERRYWVGPLRGRGLAEDAR